jgi:acetoin utilization deacetylase AcuC-like enzyme
MTDSQTPPVLFYSEDYNTDLSVYGVDKPFALDRGHCVLQQLAKDYGHEIPYTEPLPITDEDIALIHTPRYIESLSNPQTWKDIFELKPHEFNPQPDSRPLNELLDDIKLKCGGTKAAAELALATGLAANLGGGYHHAFPNEGRGYCVLHDIAISIRSLLHRNLIQRAMVVDLDFHQGDGSAVIFRDDPRVFTLSVHSEEGWPDEKQQSSLDIPIRSEEANLYQTKTEKAIAEALHRFTPDLAVYVAGSDPYELDVLPGTRYLKLSLATMRARDEFVIDTFADAGIPLAMVFAGGYGPDVWQVHYYAVRRILERASTLLVTAKN